MRLVGQDIGQAILVSANHFYGLSLRVEEARIQMLILNFKYSWKKPRPHVLPNAIRIRKKSGLRLELNQRPWGF